MCEHTTQSVSGCQLQLDADKCSSSVLLRDKLEALLGGKRLHLSPPPQGTRTPSISPTQSDDSEAEAEAISPGYPSPGPYEKALIEQQKRVECLEQENAKLRSRVSALEAALETAREILVTFTGHSPYARAVCSTTRATPSLRQSASLPASTMPLRRGGALHAKSHSTGCSTVTMAATMSPVHLSSVAPLTALPLSSDCRSDGGPVIHHSLSEMSTMVHSMSATATMHSPLPPTVSSAVTGTVVSFGRESDRDRRRPMDLRLKRSSDSGAAERRRRIGVGVTPTASQCLSVSGGAPVEVNKKGVMVCWSCWLCAEYLGSSAERVFHSKSIVHRFRVQKAQTLRKKKPPKGKSISSRFGDSTAVTNPFQYLKHYPNGVVSFKYVECDTGGEWKIRNIHVTPDMKPTARDLEQLWSRT